MTRARIDGSGRTPPPVRPAPPCDGPRPAPPRGSGRPTHCRRLRDSLGRPTTGRPAGRRCGTACRSRGGGHSPSRYKWATPRPTSRFRRSAAPVTPGASDVRRHSTWGKEERAADPPDTATFPPRTESFDPRRCGGLTGHIGHVLRHGLSSRGPRPSAPVSTGSCLPVPDAALGTHPSPTAPGDLGVRLLTHTCELPPPLVCRRQTKGFRLWRPARLRDQAVVVRPGDTREYRRSNFYRSLCPSVFPLV